MGQRIAIIGSGISGLGAAWALNEDNEITIFEADERIGGHSNTVDVTTDDGVTSVDTGFIVYNEVTYPNLTRLFATLGVATDPSDMSFSFSRDRHFEYGASLGGIMAKPSNLLRPRFVRMLVEIDRFRRTGADIDPGPEETIQELLDRHGFGPGFRDDYLYPMTGAIWSSSNDMISAYPARAIMAFLHNHGLVEIVGRPKWRTVSGGSRSYVDRLISGFRDKIVTGTPVDRVVRTKDQASVIAGGSTTSFDQVIFATHSDQAMDILGADATEAERRLLGGLRYQANSAVLHSDPALMPAKRSVWAAWNAISRSDHQTSGVASVTYWMNRLQELGRAPELFVSLNPIDEPDPRLTHARFDYSHPLFDSAAIASQQGISTIQGENNTWFAGAYLGYGFHEDGLQSGLNVAAALGSPAPWHGSFEPVSSARLVTQGA